MWCCGRNTRPGRKCSWTGRARRFPSMTPRRGNHGRRRPQQTLALFGDDAIAAADIVVLSDDPSDHDHLIELLRGLHNSIRLVLLLDSYDRNLVVNALRAGPAVLFCRASQPFRALCRCITVVHQGQFWANTEQIGYLVEALSFNFSPRVLNAKGVGSGRHGGSRSSTWRDQQSGDGAAARYQR
jgi:hypothetical protein